MANLKPGCIFLPGTDTQLPQILQSLVWWMGLRGWGGATTAMPGMFNTGRKLPWVMARAPESRNKSRDELPRHATPPEFLSGWLALPGRRDIVSCTLVECNTAAKNRRTAPGPPEGIPQIFSFFKLDWRQLQTAWNISPQSTTKNLWYARLSCVYEWSR